MSDSGTQTRPDILDRASLSSLDSGFALYAVGISVWMTMVACGGTTYMLPLVSDGMSASVYVVAQQLSYVLTYFVVAAVAWRGCPKSPHLMDILAACAFTVMDACLIPIMFGSTSAPLLVIFGISMGVGTTLGYMQWIRVVSYRRDVEVLLLLFIASFVSIVTSAGFYFVPGHVRTVLFGAVLVPLSLVLMWLNTQSLARVTPRGGQTGARGKGGLVMRSILVPAVCAMVLTLVAPLASTTFVDVQGHDLFRMQLSQGANLLALVALAIFYLGFRRGVSMRQTYTVLMPVLASAVLVAAFFEPSQRWFVLFLGDMCFCAVSFLLLLTSCDLSKRLDVPTMVTYGILGGCVYLARLPEALLVVNPYAIESASSSVATAVLIYLLAVPVFVLPMLMRRSAVDSADAAGPVVAAGSVVIPGELVGTATSPSTGDAASLAGEPGAGEGTREVAGLAISATQALFAQTCSRIAGEAELTPRQADVMAKLVEGESIQRIGDDLALSENTVRTYRKLIYAALDVHSKQELRDYVLARATDGADTPESAT